MALDPGIDRSVSPESSGRDSPIPRQWKTRLGGSDPQIKDKAYRRYAAGVEKALSLFETALEEWADYISFLNRLLKALQGRPPSFHTIPSNALVAKRLSQCLNPSLPSGVHQKALEVYQFVCSVIGKDGLARDLPLYLPGLAPTLSFASLSVRSPYLDLLEKYFLGLDPRALRPAIKSIILALLPGLEDETSEDFERTLRLVGRFKEVIRPADSELITDDHSSGDDFFWQCFFLASITSSGRRAGALAYLNRFLPVLGSSGVAQASDEAFRAKLAPIVTSPEPGLLIRCFASGLIDEQLLIQRGFLDLLVTHLPLHCGVLQSLVKSADLELILKAATGVVIRRDMSLNRRLWSWLLGPEPHGQEDQSVPTSPGGQQPHISSSTSYFEDYGLQPLTKALLDMIKTGDRHSIAERARPYRICLSLMDRWEIGGLVVPEVFLPVLQSVKTFQSEATSTSEFKEVLRSASFFFDGIESGLIYGEVVGLLVQAMGPGNQTIAERLNKLDMVNFILTQFNVREEEMVTIHAPLTCLAGLAMLEDCRSRHSAEAQSTIWSPKLTDQVLGVLATLLELIPERAFPGMLPSDDSSKSSRLPNMEVLKKIRSFYVQDQGNIDASPSPFPSITIGESMLQKALDLVCDKGKARTFMGDLSTRVRVLSLAMTRTPESYKLDQEGLLSFLHEKLQVETPLPFADFSSILQLLILLHSADRIHSNNFSSLVGPLVCHAWSYLSAPEPRHHVEAVRCLWQLQTALTPANRDIEAALSGLFVEQRKNDPTTVARGFSVLWSHTLQDNPSDRRGTRTPMVEHKSASSRLAGMDNYELMLTQPLFLVLDALLDERTQLYMTVKSWLTSMIGIDRLFLVFVTRLSEIPFLRKVGPGNESEKSSQTSATFADEDDLDLCLYYLRTLNHVLGCAGDISWAVLSTKHLSFNGSFTVVSSGGEENDMTLLEFFVRVSMRCIMADPPPSTSRDLDERVTQLHRFALSLLHHFFLSQHASNLAALHLEDILLDRLLASLNSSDPYVQVLLLDVVYDALKLRQSVSSEAPASPTSEKRNASVDPVRPGRSSFSPPNEQRPTPYSPPPQLLKCLQAGLASIKSRAVLDSWVAFLAECLPFYSNSIFQVLIPLIETLCAQVDATFVNLCDVFRPDAPETSSEGATPESTLIYLLNGLEQILGRAHDQLLAEETRAQMFKSPDQPQSLFGSMVSGVFQSDPSHSRSATANDRLTVHLSFQDAVRICFKIWAWGQGADASALDADSSASFNHTSLRMRNRARRLLEHLFNAETLECLETMIDIWRSTTTTAEHLNVFNFLSALDGSRPRHTIPALFNSIYSRTNPGALEPSRKSTMTISLADSDLAVFLVEYARSLDDDAMDEIWQDCMTFLKDILNNPFPHRQTLPSLLEFAAILGEKVDNTNFGEQRKMRRELGDLFLRLLAALFTTRPMTFSEVSSSSSQLVKPKGDAKQMATFDRAFDRSTDVVLILASVVPKLHQILVEPDRVLSAAGTISTNVIAPTLRSKIFPETVSRSTMKLLHELSRLQNNQKTWKRDVGEAFNDSRFFGMDPEFVREDWLPLLRQWTVADKDKLAEIVGRISPPSTAGIVFGVGATSARLEADRKTQLNLRRIALLVLASTEDAFVGELPTVFDKMVELLSSTATSSPSSTTRADVFIVVRALALRISSIHLALLWPVVNAEIHAAMSSVVAPDHSAASDIYTNATILQACKTLDLLICLAPDDFQLHEWLFINDTVDAIYRSASSQPIALIDELSDELGNVNSHAVSSNDSVSHSAASRSQRRPLLGAGGISDAVSLERKDELVAKVLRPFFGQLSIFTFETTYAMTTLDREACVQELLKDVFDERTIARAL